MKRVVLICFFSLLLLNSTSSQESLNTLAGLFFEAYAPMINNQVKRDISEKQKTEYLNTFIKKWMGGDSNIYIHDDLNNPTNDFLKKFDSIKHYTKKLREKNTYQISISDITPIIIDSAFVNAKVNFYVTKTTFKSENRVKSHRLIFTFKIDFDINYNIIDYKLIGIFPYFDSDGDGLDYSRDNCPDIPGLYPDNYPHRRNGCPDNDMDGYYSNIKNYQLLDLNDSDECYPDSFSIVCDYDDDKVFDNIDQCRDTPIGQEVNEYGCPKGDLPDIHIDSDLDGIIDPLDDCPKIPGTSSSGCLEYFVKKDIQKLHSGMSVKISSLFFHEDKLISGDTRGRVWESELKPNAFVFLNEICRISGTIKSIVSLDQQLWISSILKKNKKTSFYKLSKDEKKPIVMPRPINFPADNQDLRIDVLNPDSLESMLLNVNNNCGRVLFHNENFVISKCGLDILFWKKMKSGRWLLMEKDRGANEILTTATISSDGIYLLLGKGNGYVEWYELK